MILILEIRRANGEMDEAVNYQVMSAKDLVGSVFTQGGWSNFLVCSYYACVPMISVLYLTVYHLVLLLVLGEES